MKFGFRKPSWKKSLSAATSGALNRAIKKAIIPGYGQKGMGIANPKKYLYNRVYSMATVDVLDVIHNKNNRDSISIDSACTTNDMDKSKRINISQNYRTELKQLKTLLQRCRSEKLDKKIISAIERILKYEQQFHKAKHLYKDFGSYILDSLEQWMSESKKEWIQVEGKLAVMIMKEVQDNKTTDDIVANIYNLPQYKNSLTTI